MKYIIHQRMLNAVKKMRVRTQRDQGSEGRTSEHVTFDQI
jgi:hypothetical protein